MNGKHKRKTLGFSLLSAVALLAVLLQAPASEANHTGTVSVVFESKDGNLAHDDSVDWNDFWSGSAITATGTSWSFQKFGDRTGNPDDIFNGGVKQDRNCPTVKDGSLGSGSGKIDLSRIYLAHQKVSGSDFLFVAWGRVDGSDAASSHVAYEFNRGTTPCGNGLTNRIAGDVLIVYDFSGGDADATFKVLRWITPAAPGTGVCEVANNVPPCWGDKLTLTPTNADGDVNVGVSVVDGIAGDTLGPVQFGEAALNLTAAGIDPCSLNGTVMGVSRSSGDSGSAQMKDKVGPGGFTLPGCTQATTITTKVRITDTASLQGFDSTFVGDHTGTLTFNLYPPTAAGATCSGTPVFTSTHSNVATSTFVASGYYEATATGTYRWKVDYTGDSANLPSNSGCGTELVTINYGF